MTPAPDEDDDVPDPRRWWQRRSVQLLGGVALVGVLFLLTRHAPPARHDEAKDKDGFIGVVSPYRAARAEPADEPPPPPPPPPAASAPPPTHPPPPPQTAAQPPPRATMQPVPRPPVLLGNATPAVPPWPVMLSYVVPPPIPPAKPPADPPETDIAFKTGTIPGLKASPALDETYLLMPGLLPCVLDTAIESDLPGPIACHLPGPVYSTKGVLLMETETQVVGTYASMGKAGVNRLEAGSLFAHTPRGIWVPLTGQPFADDLGRSGLAGAVDNHYTQRFGAALILTLTQSVLGIVQSEASKGGNTYLNLNQGGGAGGLAQQILQSQINIPPTFSKHQGEMIALWLTAPIDFSSSYKLREIKP
jgi:type IV secretion system protein VirB10